jgi:hypothetical protein
LTPTQSCVFSFNSKNGYITLINNINQILTIVDDINVKFISVNTEDENNNSQTSSNNTNSLFKLNINYNLIN